MKNKNSTNSKTLESFIAGDFESIIIENYKSFIIEKCESLVPENCESINSESTESFVSENMKSIIAENLESFVSENMKSIISENFESIILEDSRKEITNFILENGKPIWQHFKESNLLWSIYEVDLFNVPVHVVMAHREIFKLFGSKEKADSFILIGCDKGQVLKEFSAILDEFNSIISANPEKLSKFKCVVEFSDHLQ